MFLLLQTSKPTENITLSKNFFNKNIFIRFCFEVIDRVYKLSDKLLRLIYKNWELPVGWNKSQKQRFSGANWK